MLKIQVLGKGLIPRGLGIAPRKEFFPADFNLIHTILLCPGLKVNMLCPENNKVIPVTNTNLKRLWDKYRSDKFVTTTTPVSAKPVEVKPVNSTEEDKNSKLVVEDPKIMINPNTISIIKENNEESVKLQEYTKDEEKSEAEKTEDVVTEEKKEDTTTDAPIKPVTNPNNNNNNNNYKNNNYKNHHKK